MKKLLFSALMLAAAIAAKEKDNVKDVQPVHSDSWTGAANQSGIVKEVRQN